MYLQLFYQKHVMYSYCKEKNMMLNAQHQSVPEKYRYGWTEWEPVGRVYVVVGAGGIVAIQLGVADEEAYLHEMSAKLNGTLEKDRASLRPLLTQLDEYFQGKRHEFDVQVDISRLTPFQQNVLAYVTKIPYGSVRSYGEIAHALHNPAASRAVGAANGANPVPVVIPCHRVLGAKGQLTGYGGGKGIETKRHLLELEGYFPQTALHGF